MQNMSDFIFCLGGVWPKNSVLIICYKGRQPCGQNLDLHNTSQQKITVPFLRVQLNISMMDNRWI